jgi:hypothetical protein
VLYVTFNTSVDATVLLPPVKLPAEYNVPVVLSIVAEPLILMKQPATVPEPVNVNDTAAEPALVVTFDGVEPDDVAELNVIVGRLPEYVGALAKPDSNQPA